MEKVIGLFLGIHNTLNQPEWLVSYDEFGHGQFHDNNDRHRKGI